MVANYVVILVILTFATNNAQNIGFGSSDENFQNPDFLADSLFGEEQSSDNEIFEEDFGVSDVSRYILINKAEYAVQSYTAGIM